MEESLKGPIAKRELPEAEKWTWRYETPFSIDDNEYAGEGSVGTAWLQLQLVHTSYRHFDTKEYRELTVRLESIEQLFLDREDLEGYYNQCFAPEENFRITGPSGELYDSRSRYLSG